MACIAHGIVRKAMRYRARVAPTIAIDRTCAPPRKAMRAAHANHAHGHATCCHCPDAT